MYKIAAQIKALGDAVTEEVVAQIVARMETSQPHLAGVVKALTAWVKNCAGGVVNPVYLDQLQRFLATLDEP